MAHDPLYSIRVGSRIQGARLAEQAATTLELAAQHLAALAAFGITKPRLGEYRGLLGQVQRGAANRAVNRQESTLATEKQNRAFLEAKDWLRKLLAIADNTFVHEPATNQSFNLGKKIGPSTTRLIESLSERLELAKNNAAALASWGGTAAFLKEGQRLLDELRAFDVRQETLLAGLPKGTQDYHFVKGELLIALKRINRAAKAAFLTDRAMRSKFNLDILYRDASTRRPTAVVPATRS